MSHKLSSMILPEIFILLGACMLLLMSFAKKESSVDVAIDPGKELLTGILRAQTNAIIEWFEYGSDHKEEYKNNISKCSRTDNETRTIRKDEK